MSKQDEARPSTAPATPAQENAENSTPETAQPEESSTPREGDTAG